MFATTLKSLLAHRFRMLATALAIALGVAFMAGTLVLTDTMRQTFDNLFADVYRGTDVVVRVKAAFEGPQGGADLRGRVDAALIPRVQAVPGVSVAEGGVFGYARLVGKGGKALGNPTTGAPVLGTAWSDTGALNPFNLVAGAPPRADDEVVIDKKSAGDGHLAVGDTTTVLVLGPPQRVRISGIARFGNADSPGGATTVIFTRAAAQRLVAEPGKFDSIEIVGTAGVSQAELAHRIGAVLPAGTEAITGKAITAENQSAIRKALSFFNTFLLIFAVIALLVGGFMMFNTFAITVAQRTRENGLLRALGASRRQVLGSVLIEAFLVGLIASLVGMVAGVGVAVGLKNLLKATGVDIPAQGVVVRPGTEIIALVVGIGVTVVAALSPARRAAKVPPVAAMQLGVAGGTGYGSRQRILVGAAVLTAGVASLLWGLFGGVSQPVRLVGAGALLVFFGMSVLGRSVASPLSRLIGAPLPRLRGITGEIARENAMRNPGRTAASASALMIGVGLVGFITIFVSSAKASIDHSISSGFTGDIVLDTGGGVGGGVDPALAERVAKLPEVAVAAGLRQGVAQIGGAGTFLQAGDPATLLSIMRIDPREGSVNDLDAGSIAVYDKTARDKRWTIGSQIPAVFAKTGPRTLRLALIYSDNTQAGNYLLSRSGYEANFAGQFDSKVLIRKAPGVSTAAALAAVGTVAKDYPGVDLLDKAQYTHNQTAPFNQLLALIYALLGLAIVIALLGIANTLALSITERTREVGLLRAVGMTRSQLRSAIRWESVIIALQGTLLGLAIGIFFGWSLVAAMHDQGITVFRVPVISLLAVVLIAAVAGMIAAVPPSRRAAKLDVLRAVVSD
ncbi:ABC transporter permease [Jatrophihabitans sp.]|uniref:ABC transporter permease n=1 Tax=Jatrophihabitans sp. TaxID=1932789 RepID=UPI002BC7372B|nr:FtsX-like permease family protein [Jatrophihabitans sp.]